MEMVQQSRGLHHESLRHAKVLLSIYSHALVQSQEGYALKKRREKNNLNVNLTRFCNSILFPINLLYLHVYFITWTENIMSSSISAHNQN